MKISLLICIHSPNSDYDKLVERAIKSVAAQSRQPDDVVIVLDECHPGHRGFGPDTKCVIQNLLSYEDKYDLLNKIKFYERDKKEGLASAKNFGFQYCTGDYITYLDADDYWHNTKLEIQEKCALQNPSLDIIATNAWDVYPNGLVYPNCFSVEQYKSNEQIAIRLPAENVICHGSVMLKRQVLQELGYRDVRGAEDYDLWKRCVAKGYKFYKIPERLYYYSMGTGVPR